MEQSFTCSSITYGTYGQVSAISFGKTIGSIAGTGQTEIIHQGIEVIFNVNAGLDQNVYCEPETKIVTLGEEYGSLPTPARKGYKFLGWFTASALGEGDEVKSDTAVTKETSHILYAHWTPKTYQVEYNANGGSRNYGKFNSYI